jgi:pimeloyl-ACP methyl ester carboxylesterase
MPYATIDGIKTHYEVQGSGIPLLMLAPGGFESTIDRWRINRIWDELRPLETLGGEFRMIAYDRRETGQSGGRVEPFTWELYARQAVGLLDHVGVQSAFVLGGCMGCSVALAMGTHYRERCRGLLLHWPVGGYRWMKKGHGNFDAHLEFVQAHGLSATVERARETKTFWRGRPEGGPWSAVIASDPAFAQAFARQDAERYIEIARKGRNNLFNDTMPSGAGGEELIAMNIPACIMSGDDPAHAASAAQALRELMPKSVLSPLMPPQQNGESVGRWIRDSIASMQ